MQHCIWICCFSSAYSSYGVDSLRFVIYFSFRIYFCSSLRQNSRIFKSLCPLNHPGFLWIWFLVNLLCVCVEYVSLDFPEDFMNSSAFCTPPITMILKLMLTILYYYFCNIFMFPKAGIVRTRFQQHHFLLAPTGNSIYYAPTPNDNGRMFEYWWSLITNSKMVGLVWLFNLNSSLRSQNVSKIDFDHVYTVKDFSLSVIGLCNSWNELLQFLSMGFNPLFSFKMIRYWNISGRFWACSGQELSITSLSQKNYRENLLLFCPILFVLIDHFLN